MALNFSPINIQIKMGINVYIWKKNMNYKFYSAVAFSILLISCAETAEKELTQPETTEAQEVVEEVAQEEDQLAFSGISKGDFLLYGHTDIDANDAIESDKMFTSFQENGSFEGKIKVTINEVCQKAGCWINIEKSNGETVMVFFRDHFTIPIDGTTGKNAILYGSLNADTLSVDFQKHLLDDAKEAGETVTEEEYNAIIEDKIDMTFDCESILVSQI